MRKPLMIASLLGFIGLAVPAHAALMTFDVVSSLDGLPVNATVQVETLDDQILVRLTNNIVDPTSVIQNISGVSFSLGSLTAASLNDSRGVLRNIASDGRFSDAAAGSTDWLFSINNSLIYLNALGSGGPDQTIIGAPGSGVYGAANGSIAGNRPHNGFLAGTVTFTIDAAGISAADTIGVQSLFFGTAPTEVTVNSVPEPTSLVLLCGGLLVAAARLRRR